MPEATRTLDQGARLAPCGDCPRPRCMKLRTLRFLAAWHEDEPKVMQRRRSPAGGGTAPGPTGRCRHLPVARPLPLERHHKVERHQKAARPVPVTRPLMVGPDGAVGTPGRRNRSSPRPGSSPICGRAA